MTRTVSRLREAPAQNGRIALTLSDGATYVVTLELLSLLGLTATGREVADTAIPVLEHEHNVGLLEQKALNMLGRARRSRHELELRLRRTGADRALIDEAVGRLIGKGVVDDARTAEAEAASRLRSGVGPARVRQLLAARGIDRQVASDALRAALDDTAFDERAACLEAAAKRARALSSLDNAVARRRLTAFLTRRGFSIGHITAAVNELIPRQH